MRKKKIKILHVAQAAGGVDRYIRMLLKYLDKRKLIITLCTIVAIVAVGLGIFKMLQLVKEVEQVKDYNTESLRWAIIGAIGSWTGSVFGAIALVVSLVALWLPQRVKIAVGVSTGFILSQIPGIEKIDAYIITVKNTGMKPVTVTNVYLHKLFELERFMAQVYEENGRCEAAEVAALCLANLYNSGGHRKITPDEYETIKKYLQKFPESISNNPSLNSVHQYTHQPIIQPVITPTLRSASGQGERPRRKPRVPDAPKIKHDKMKQFYMIDMGRKM